MNPPERTRRLGRGLDALLARKEPSRDTAASVADREGFESDTEQSPNNALRMLALSEIRANPFQPRKEFRPEELADLESSLRTNGLLQPIIVRPAPPPGTGFELIAGERRFRAASRLGWTEIPALVRDSDDRALLTLAMVENLQRADLDVIEEADGYHRLMDEFQFSQQKVADEVGKDRSTVANALRLRQLPAAVRRLLQEKLLSAGHARALLPLATERAIVDLARETVAQGFSVREVERRVNAARPTPATTGRKSSAVAATPAGASTAEVRRIEELLRKKLQTGVKIHLSAKDRGEVRIAFFSNDDLERVLQVLGVRLDA